MVVGGAEFKKMTEGNRDSNLYIYIYEVVGTGESLPLVSAWNGVSR